MTKMPHAIRPLRNEYLGVAKIIQTDIYLELSESQFIGLLMKNTGGGINPKRARQIYYALMKDAGV